MSCRPVCTPLQSVHVPGGWFCPVCDEPFRDPPFATSPKAWGPVRGRATFEVREDLKRLGGRWDPTNKIWWVRLAQLNEALKRARLGPGIDSPPPTPEQHAEDYVCWECGGELSLAAIKRTESGPLELPGAYWCGCTE